MKIKLSKSQWQFIGKKAGWGKVAEDGQTMPLDGVQNSPAAEVKFEKKDTSSIIETKEQSKEQMLETYLKFKDNGRANEKGITEKDVDAEELKIGIEVEYEHTTDRDTAARIALDHLAELKDYYTRLKKMEEEGKKEGSELK